jgi:hypothetical protein
MDVRGRQQKTEMSVTAETPAKAGTPAATERPTTTAVAGVPSISERNGRNPGNNRDASTADVHGRRNLRENKCQCM